MNKIDQTKITPQILEKVKEVNDEAGHRTHLEVPEMIRIICEVVEANYDVSQRNLMNELTEGFNALKEKRNMERERLDERLGKCDRVVQEETFAPHMDEEQYININDLVKDFARLIDIQKKEIIDLQAELQEYRSIAENVGAEKAVSEKEAWKKCAENLVDYAREFVANLSQWGKGYGRYDDDIKQANAAIEEYERLKNENR